MARQASARSEAFQAAHSRASTSRGASSGVCPMAERRASRILAAMRSRSAWALSGCPSRDRAKPEACSGSASRARRAASPPVRGPVPAAGTGAGPVEVLGSLGSAALACGVAASGFWRSLRRSRRRSMVVSPTRGLVRRLMAASRWGGSPCPPSWSRMAARTMSRSAAAAGSARSRTAGVREARGTPRLRRSLARVSASAALRTMTAICDQAVPWWTCSSLSARATWACSCQAEEARMTSTPAATCGRSASLAPEEGPAEDRAEDWGAGVVCRWAVVPVTGTRALWSRITAAMAGLPR